MSVSVSCPTPIGRASGSRLARLRPSAAIDTRILLMRTSACGAANEVLREIQRLESLIHCDVEDQEAKRPEFLALP